MAVPVRRASASFALSQHTRVGRMAVRGDLPHCQTCPHTETTGLSVTSNNHIGLPGAQCPM